MDSVPTMVSMFKKEIRDSLKDVSEPAVIANALAALGELGIDSGELANGLAHMSESEFRDCTPDRFSTRGGQSWDTLLAMF